MLPRQAIDAWHRAVARLVGAGDPEELAAAIAAAVGKVTDDDGTCLLAFHRDARPQVIHHSLSPRAAAHYVDRYLAGPYLLDPLYQLALDAQRDMLLRFRDQSPDRFSSSAYYKEYCERTHLVDEVDAVTPLDHRTTLALVIGRRKSRFSAAELKRLTSVSGVIYAAMRRLGTLLASRDNLSTADRVHARMLQCFKEFGRRQLTERERQVAVLLLKGHSAKSIARELRIAPGTVTVHRKNLYAKLNVSSQASLFGLFLEEMAERA